MALNWWWKEGARQEVVWKIFHVDCDTHISASKPTLRHHLTRVTLIWLHKQYLTGKLLISAFFNVALKEAGASDIIISLVFLMGNWNKGNWFMQLYVPSGHRIDMETHTLRLHPTWNIVFLANLINIVHRRENITFPPLEFPSRCIISVTLIYSVSEQPAVRIPKASWWVAKACRRFHIQIMSSSLFGFKKQKTTPREVMYVIKMKHKDNLLGRKIL